MSINIYSSEWKDGKWIKSYENKGKMQLFKWERECFIRGKTRRDGYSCCSCEKQFQKGQSFYGSRRSYTRICIKCYENFINNFIKSLKEHISNAQETLKEFKQNEPQLIRSDLASSL